MIYIVEDDSAIRELEQYALQSNGYEAVGFESSEPFWQAVHTTPPELGRHAPGPAGTGHPGRDAPR